jgi:hypothetical protein
MSTGRQIRIEIAGRDEFWGRAFHVEWQHQFADRKLVPDGAGYYLVEQDWVDDLERVACETFCRVLRAPENPRRRNWLSFIVGGRGGK